MSTQEDGGGTALKYLFKRHGKNGYWLDGAEEERNEQKEGQEGRPPEGRRRRSRRPKTESDVNSTRKKCAALVNNPRASLLKAPMA